MKLVPKSSNKPVDSHYRPGQSPLLDWMRRHNLPLTREKYLALAYPDGLPEPFGPELEAELPGQFRQWQGDAPTSNS